MDGCGTKPYHFSSLWVDCGVKELVGLFLRRVGSGANPVCWFMQKMFLNNFNIELGDFKGVTP
jgi:hypothetical protein